LSGLAAKNCPVVGDEEWTPQDLRRMGQLKVSREVINPDNPLELIRAMISHSPL